LKTNSRGGTSADERVREAVALHRQGQRQKADRIYRQVLRAHPGHPDALHFSGLLAHQCGDDETAVLRIRKAIEARPDYADAFKNLGNIMLGLDRFAEA
jgi:Flp pilus assembly protein TadD